MTLPARFSVPFWGGDDVTLDRWSRAAPCWPATARSQLDPPSSSTVSTRRRGRLSAQARRNPVPTVVEARSFESGNTPGTRFVSWFVSRSVVRERAWGVDDTGSIDGSVIEMVSPRSSLRGSSALSEAAPRLRQSSSGPAIPPYWGASLAHRPQGSSPSTQPVCAVAVRGANRGHMIAKDG